MNIVYRQGNSGQITVAATYSLAVFSNGTATVSQVVGYPNYPTSTTVIGTVTGGQKVFGPYASGATLIVEASGSDAYYETGAVSPVIEVVTPFEQPVPTAKTTAVTLTIAELLTKIVTATHTAGATAAYTLPTGTLTDAGLTNWAIGQAFDWSLINLSAAAADTVTLTAGTDHTIVGVPIIQSAHASTGTLYGNAVAFRTKKTAANTFVTYRVGG
jgi:hypothetical protein